MSIQVFDFSGKKVGEEQVPAVFSVDANQHLIWEVVTAEHANKRQGTHKTKVKGDVSGGGKKPWKQKEQVARDRVLSVLHSGKAAEPYSGPYQEAIARIYLQRKKEPAWLISLHIKLQRIS